jgi:hypothetical protein
MTKIKHLKAQPIAEGRMVGPRELVGVPSYDDHALATLRDIIDHGTIEQRIAAAAVMLNRSRGVWGP